jgi:hypothetical protein
LAASSRAVAAVAAVAAMMQWCPIQIDDPMQFGLSALAFLPHGSGTAHTIISTPSFGLCLLCSATAAAASAAAISAIFRTGACDSKHRPPALLLTLHNILLQGM